MAPSGSSPRARHARVGSAPRRCCSSQRQCDRRSRGWPPRGIRDAEARDGRHSRVIPTTDNLFLDQIEQLALAHQRIGYAKPRKLVLVRPGTGRLALAAGEIVAALADGRVVAAREPFDELFGTADLGGPHDLRKGRIGFCHGDVLAQRSGKQEILLRHHADVRSQVKQVDFPQIDPVDLDHSVIGRVQALQQAGDRRFPGAAAAHDAEHRARRDSERNPGKGVRRIGRIAKPHVLNVTSPLTV